jgi:uncharacterized protein YndB with AHSA1/START domain
MAQAHSPSQTTLQVKRTFAASRERVFRAWTEAEELRHWFFPSPDYTVVIPILDLRVGGKYQVEMRHKESGNVHRLEGIYREIKPPEKVAFTWQWEPGASASETLVTVEFHDLGPSTEIVLTHELFPNLEERDKHSHGWTGCLDQLAKIF